MLRIPVSNNIDIDTNDSNQLLFSTPRRESLVSSTLSLQLKKIHDINIIYENIPILSFVYYNPLLYFQEISSSTSSSVLSINNNKLMDDLSIFLFQYNDLLTDINIYWKESTKIVPSNILPSSITCTIKFFENASPVDKYWLIHRELGRQDSTIFNETILIDDIKLILPVIFASLPYIHNISHYLEALILSNLSCEYISIITLNLPILAPTIAEYIHKLAIKNINIASSNRIINEESSNLTMLPPTIHVDNSTYWNSYTILLSIASKTKLLANIIRNISSDKNSLSSLCLYITKNFLFDTEVFMDMQLFKSNTIFDCWIFNVDNKSNDLFNISNQVIDSVVVSINNILENTFDFAVVELNNSNEMVITSSIYCDSRSNNSNNRSSSSSSSSNSSSSYISDILDNFCRSCRLLVVANTVCQSPLIMKFNADMNENNNSFNQQYLEIVSNINCQSMKQEKLSIIKLFNLSYEEINNTKSLNHLFQEIQIYEYSLRLSISLILIRLLVLTSNTKVSIYKEIIDNLIVLLNYSINSQIKLLEKLKFNVKHHWPLHLQILSQPVIQSLQSHILYLQIVSIYDFRSALRDLIIDELKLRQLEDSLIVPLQSYTNTMKILEQIIPKTAPEILLNDVRISLFIIIFNLIYFNFI
jgi:hypothetical protein